ncbi:MAG: UDP-N-acetylmuramoyl-L-alanine--D-glutamate ligase [Parasporobacterium sp.]|nr:UDP-N-acetylmuramoyl-L-alanine--D-glutamate ligase [Parasporobacterium sp.]
MDLTNKKILIYGMGISGKGTARLLKSKDVIMVLYDKKEDLDRQGLLKELDLPETTQILTGTLRKEDLEGIDALVISPGVPAREPGVQMAKDLGLQILGELEIAFEASRGRVIGITGTNGKTTTTALVGEIMKAVFPEVFVVGNIGTSFASVADETTKNSVIVAEVSSFQLESIRVFHPEVSAVLNLTPDHLDRHGTFENYAACKMRIAENQTPEQKCIINYDDEYLRRLSEDLIPEPLYFSRKEKLQKGVYLDQDVIMYSDGTQTVPVLNRYDMNLLGDHNVENVMAAIGIAVSFGVELDLLVPVIRNFKAVEHRIEFVCEKNGVTYYNDSKGTNTDAAAKAVQSMVAPTILIAGGYDKGADFTDWIRGFNGKIRDMILIGATAEKIRESALSCGFTSLHMEGDLESAVKKAAALARKGDAVLLSPACASWDQFKSYEQRGRLFKDYVKNL